LVALGGFFFKMVVEKDNWVVKGGGGGIT